LQKVVVKVDVHDNKDKKVAMRAVSSLQAVRKHWCAETVGPATDPEKEEEAKKGEREKKKDADAMTTYYYVQSAEENPSA
ncbi:unnamed protein product, partial [Musa acuminata var. zebrina]